MHLHQNQSETTGSLERNRGSGGAATTVEGRYGGSWRRSGDLVLMEDEVMEKKNNMVVVKVICLSSKLTVTYNDAMCA